MLLDRRAERARLDRLLNDARAGLSGALVLWGEAGIGKTALVEYCIGGAADLQLGRVVGVESEMELGFAALHQLMVPFLAGLEVLAAPQRQALGCALGLMAGPPPDRFLVGLAVLSLLAAAAEEQPLLCVVDDAQWLDHTSADVLAFVARRLRADGIAFIFAVREPANRPLNLEGLPELEVKGLSHPDGRALLASLVAGPVDDRVAECLVNETAGNPLALVALAGELSAGQLAGQVRLPEPLPLGKGLQDYFECRLQTLPHDSQMLLLLAAAEPSGNPSLYWQAAAALELSADAAAAAAAARLITVGSTISFRHPVIRSAVYHRASDVDRRRIHGALAEASRPDRDADRRAWHRAAAAVGPSEEVANELERSARRAQRRGGQAAAAAYFTRAAELTTDPDRQAERLLGAAQAELAVGSPAIAQGLLEQATPLLADSLGQARAARLQGAIRFAVGEGGETPAILLRAARLLEGLDARLARETLLEALEAAHWAGRFATGGAIDEIAEAAQSVRLSSPSPLTAADLLLEGFTTILRGHRQAGVPLLRRSVEMLDGDQLAEEDLRWLGLACCAAAELLDNATMYRLASRWVRLCRQQGALTDLPLALGRLGCCEVMAGRFAAAETCFAEVDDVSMATGNSGLLGATAPQQLLLLAWRGQEKETRSAAASVTREGIDQSQD
jgi:hypothetical protein